MAGGVREALQSLGVPFKERGESPLVTEGWVGIPCPYCGTDGRPGFGINLRTLRCSCWKCGTHRLADALAEAAGVSVGEVLGVLKGVSPDLRVSSADAPRGKYTPPDPLEDLGPSHRKYLARRGYDPDRLVEEWGLRGIGPVATTASPGPGRRGFLSWRIFIPVSHPDAPGKKRGQWMRTSWTTRAVGRGVEPRYLSAPPDCESVPLKSSLLGLESVGHAAVVVEGPFDAFRVGPGAVCTFGLSYTRAQVLLLSRIPVRVICFDNDPAAQARAHKLSDELAPFPGETHVAVLSGPDPDSSPEAEVDELRRQFLA